MATTTTNLALPKPALTDAADITTAVGPLADAVDTIVDAVNKRYQTIRERQGFLSGSRPSVTRLFIGPLAADATGALSGAGIGGGVGPAAFYLDPARHPVGGRSLKLNLSAWTSTGSTAPASDFTFALYPVTAGTGTSAASEVTLGTIVSGSSCTITAPGANGLSPIASSDFTFPTAGFYALTVLNSATTAANSYVNLTVDLSFRVV